MNNGGDEIAIRGIKNDFLIKTGKHIKVLECGRWESAANFTFKAPINIIVDMVFDATNWTWEDTYEKKKGKFKQGEKNCYRSDSKVVRRSLIDYIAINNGCKLLDIASYTERDHTTIIHSIKTFEERLEHEGYLRQLLLEVVDFCRVNLPSYRGKAKVIGEV